MNWDFFWGFVIGSILMALFWLWYLAEKVAKIMMEVVEERGYVIRKDDED